jgi:mRNA interferase RelE/StbE
VIVIIGVSIVGEFSSKTIKELISLINVETSSNSLKLFKNDVKKLKDRNLLLKIFSAVREIKIDYSVGDLKTGDLCGVRTVKINYNNVAYRIAYYVDKPILDSEKVNIMFIHVGSRGNFYKELRDYFRNQKSILKYINNKAI